MAFAWDETKEQAAVLVAVGELTGQEICKECGIVESTLYLWKNSEEFQSRVQENRDEIRKRVFSEGVADLANRVRRYNRRWNQINRIFEQRAADTTHAGVPGWDTGLLCHEQKSLGSGEIATVIDVYKADVGTIKEERELAKQAAQELGQWEEKTRTSFDLSSLSDEDLLALERLSSKIAPKS